MRGGLVGDGTDILVREMTEIIGPRGGRTMAPTGRELFRHPRDGIWAALRDAGWSWEWDGVNPMVKWWERKAGDGDAA